MRSMQYQIGSLGIISAFACRHRETKKNLCQGGRSQDLPDTDLYYVSYRPCETSNHSDQAHYDSNTKY